MKQQLPILFLILFLVMLGFGIIIPVMPYYAEELGASEKIFGWLMASYSIMQFIFAPIWGKVSDSIGRKPILLIGISGYIISFAIFAFANELWMLFIARILAGILSSATLPTAMAIVADSTNEKKRGRGMGILGAGMGLGFIFGPAIGGFLSKYSILGLSNLATPFLFTASFALIPLIMAFLFLKESLQKTQRVKVGHLLNIKGILYLAQKYNSQIIAILNNDSLKLVYFSAFIVSFTLAGLEGTFAFFVFDRAALDATHLGYMFAIMGIANALVQGGLIGKLINKFGEEVTIKLGLLVSSLGFFLIIFAESFLTFTFFLAIFGIGNGMVRPSISSLISKRTVHGQGTAIGVMNSMDSLGRIAGPPLAGLLYFYVIESPYFIGGILTLVYLLIFHFGYKPKASTKV